MRNTVSKAIIASVAAVALGAALVATTEPAAAQWRGGGGWHGGGWHGGGWHGGYGRSWHPGYWRGGVWYGGWWGPAAVAGALAAGALAAGAYPYGYGYGYGYPNGCVQVRPLYAPNGAWIGNGPVNVCQ